MGLALDCIGSIDKKVKLELEFFLTWAHLKGSVKSIGSCIIIITSAWRCAVPDPVKKLKIMWIREGWAFIKVPVQWYFATKATPIAQSIGINELCQPFFLFIYISESDQPTWEQSDGLCLEPTTPDPSSILCLEKNIMVRFEIITKCHEVEESDFQWWLPMSMLIRY